VKAKEKQIQFLRSEDSRKVGLRILCFEAQSGIYGIENSRILVGNEFNGKAFPHRNLARFPFWCRRADRRIDK
jgi:hypothetical protein